MGQTLIFDSQFSIYRRKLSIYAKNLIETQLSVSKSGHGGPPGPLARPTKSKYIHRWYSQFDAHVDVNKQRNVMMT